MAAILLLLEEPARITRFPNDELVRYLEFPPGPPEIQMVSIADSSIGGPGNVPLGFDGTRFGSVCASR